MPRSKYPALSKVIQNFALENGIEYRIMDEFEIIRKNWDMYRTVSTADAVPGTRHFEGKQINWGGRGESVSH